MNISYLFECEECGKGFSPERCDAKFCSVRCRSRSHIRTKRYKEKIAPLQAAIAGLEQLLHQQAVYRQKINHHIDSLAQQRQKDLATYNTFVNQQNKLKQEAMELVPVDSSIITSEGISLYSTEFLGKINKLGQANGLNNVLHQFLSKLKRIDKWVQEWKAQLQVVERKSAELIQQIREKQAALDKVRKPRKRRSSQAGVSKDFKANNTQKLEGAADFAARKFVTTTFPGNLGAFLGSLDRHKTAFALTGDPGAGKSHLACAMAKLFSEHGLKVAFYQIEMGKGEIFSQMVKRYKLSNRVKISDEATLEDVKKAASVFDCIIIDSFTKLKEDQDAFDELVKQHPTTIFVAIFQKTSTGSIRGGADIAFDSSAVIDVTLEGGRRIAYMQKSRYGTIGCKYDVMRDEVL